MTNPAEELPAHYSVAEWMLLASLIEKPELFASIEADLFYLVGCREVLGVITEIKNAGRQVDWTSVAMMLYSQSKPEALTAISKALDELPSPANWPYWLEICQEFRAARRMGSLAVELGDAAKNEVWKVGIPDVASFSERLKAIGDEALPRQARSAANILPAVIDRMDKVWADPDSIYGVRTPFNDLDEITNGFQPGSLNVLAARPGMGKTAFASNCAAFAAIASVPVAFFSLETSETGILSRILCAESRVPAVRFHKRTATQRDFDDQKLAQLRIAKAPLFIYDSTSDIADIHREISSAISHHGIKFVIVDYLQRIQMRTCRENHFAKVGAVSNALKDFAMEFKLPILALAQISREVEKDQRAPVLSDLRDSGQIEQDADLICFLYQDKTAGFDDVSLSVLKNRNGPVGKIYLSFDRSITRFYAAARLKDDSQP